MHNNISSHNGIANDAQNVTNIVDQFANISPNSNARSRIVKPELEGTVFGRNHNHVGLAYLSVDDVLQDLVCARVV
jgi:hypothetical protein